MMWEVLFHDLSSCELLVVKLSVGILERGIGPMGHIHIPSVGALCTHTLGVSGVMHFSESWLVSKKACIPRGRGGGGRLRGS